MNQTHAALVQHIKTNIPDDLSELIKDKTDEQIIRAIFSNYRGMHGMRLTEDGIKIISSLFRVYEIDRETFPTARELLYLDHIAKLPYHIDDNGKILMFDPELAMKLKLADGEISTLFFVD